MFPTSGIAHSKPGVVRGESEFRSELGAQIGESVRNQCKDEGVTALEFVQVGIDAARRAFFSNGTSYHNAVNAGVAAAKRAEGARFGRQTALGV